MINTTGQMGQMMAPTPDMLQAMLTDPRATPQQRAAAVAQLSAMQGGGGGQGSQGAPQAPVADMGADAGDDPASWLQSGAAAAGDGPAPAAAPDGGGGGHDAARPHDLADWHPELMDMIKKDYESVKDDTLTSEDKGLALAKAGFGMAASGSPYLGVAIGEGASAGIKGLEDAKKDRAVARMKLLALGNTAMGTQALMGQRVANTAKVNQGVDLNEGAKLTPETAGPIVQHMLETGDLSDMSKTGVGLVGNYNKRLIYDLLSQENPDLANQALTYAQTLSEHKSYGTGMGARAAGPVTINPSEGVVTNPAPAPAPLMTQRPAPATAAPQSAPMATPAPAMAPAPAAAAVPPSLIPAATPFAMPMNPAEKSQQTSMGVQLGKRAEEIDAQGATSLDGNYLLNQMRAENKTWDMGKGSTVLQTGKAYLDGINNMLPDALKVDDGEMQKSVGDFQAFNKNAMELARQTVRATSARAAFQEMQMIQKALPSADMTRQGFDQIAAQLQGANDFRLAQQQAKDKWMKQNNNNLNGFDAWFNRSFNPAVFLLHRLSPEDRDIALKKMNQDATGRAAIAKLKDQASYVQKLGLFDSLQ